MSYCSGSRIEDVRSNCISLICTKLKTQFIKFSRPSKKKKENKDETVREICDGCTNWNSLNHRDSMKNKMDRVTHVCGLRSHFNPKLNYIYRWMKNPRRNKKGKQVDWSQSGDHCTLDKWRSWYEKKKTKNKWNELGPNYAYSTYCVIFRNHLFVNNKFI